MKNKFTFSIALAMVVSFTGMTQITAAQTGTMGAKSIQMSYVTIMNNLSVVGVGGTGLSQATTLEFIGTSCAPISLGKGTYTDTYVELTGLSQQLTSCMASHRGKTVRVVLKGASGTSNSIDLAIPLFSNQVQTSQPSAVPESPTSSLQTAPIAPGTTISPQQQNEESRFEDTSPTPSSRCVVNGKEVSCEEVMNVAKSGLKTIGSILLIIITIGVVCFVFWAWMLIHAISKPIQHKAIWIICFLIFGIVTAIIYYFAVKRTYTETIPPVQDIPIPPPPPAPGV